MKYVRMHEQTSRGNGKTTLVYESTYEPVFTNGGTITITNEGYRLTTQTGETIKRGKETNIFPVMKALDFDVQPLQVVDEMKGEELPYSEYVRKYGHGLIERTNPRRFRFVILSEENATSFGIVERKEGETLAIHSLYEAQYMTNKERTNYLLDYISALLHAEDFAYLNGHGASESDFRKWYINDELQALRLYGTSLEKANKEARELAEDAKERRSSIVETMNVYEEDV